MQGVVAANRAALQILVLGMLKACASISDQGSGFKVNLRKVWDAPDVSCTPLEPLSTIML